MINEHESTNWSQSVAGIVIKENTVLLVRHTYGAGKGKLIIPGGYVNFGESPQDAVKREIAEETGMCVMPLDVIGVRFNTHDWYVVFSAEYVSGIARSDGNENSEVVWIDIEDIPLRDDVPDLTKKLIQRVRRGKENFKLTPYEGSAKYAPYSLYC